MIVPTATDANTRQGLANLGSMSQEAVCQQREGRLNRQCRGLSGVSHSSPLLEALEDGQLVAFVGGDAEVEAVGFHGGDEGFELA